MKTIVVYDSYFGNTEKTARAIAAAFEKRGGVAAIKASEATAQDLVGAERLFVGSPTRAFRATKEINAFLKRLPKNGLCGIRAAAFDTRMDVAAVKSPILSFLAGIFGYAAEPISKSLARLGAAVTLRPAGFFVSGTEGPLNRGELERAVSWASALE